MESWINQTLNSDLDVWYFVRALFHLLQQTETIKNLTNITKWTNNETTSHTGIYSIPCKDCNKHYIYKTQYNLEKRIYEHKRSIKTNDHQNALFSHMLEFQHTFNFSQATLIKPIHCKNSQRVLESPKQTI